MTAIRSVATATVILLVFGTAATTAFADGNRFPGEHWASKPPADVGMSAEKLDQLADKLGGRGCVIKDGFVVQSWGDQSEKGDWLSSAKPVFSTLLFFAIEEGKVEGVHQKLTDFDWPLEPKDRSLEFFHLANMISGYKRPEAPGEAWAYNDYAIQLYQKTLFERVFQAAPDDVLADPRRLGPLQFEDGISFRKDRNRVVASVRDFARLGWFWLNKGDWNGKQLLPRKYFDLYMQPQVPKDLPLTADGEGEDYLGIGSFGGGSAHFTEYGSGIYGFNWWFNSTGHRHPETLTWPDAPADTIMSIGAGGNNTVIIPSLNLVLASARGDWGNLKAGDPDNKFNEHIKLLVSAAPPALTKGGVVMTFDDRNFDDWVRALPLFEEFGVKATFFISGKIDGPAIAAIQTLREHGHAIGSHSVNHLRAVEFVTDNSAEEYLGGEILPQLEEFEAAGVSPVSFAYPMSNNNAVTDEALLTIFRHIRTGKNIAAGQRLSEVDRFFVPAQEIRRHGCLYAKGIDHAPTRPDRTFEQIDSALTRAAQNDEIIVLYAHRISETGTRNFVTPEALARVFGKAKELGLQFYTFDELP